MIDLLIKVLPYIFILYFLFRFMKEPIYLLGIPFILFLRNSIFVDQALIFSVPGSYDPDIRFLGWFLIVWLAISLKSYFMIESNELDRVNKRGMNYLDYLIIALIVVTSVGLVLTLKHYHMVEDVYTQFLTLLSLFIGFFLIKDIVRYSKLNVLSEFLYVIVIINSIASFLYLLHQGLHINIYGENSEYLSIDFQGGLITRTFWFMPVLWFFSIAYLLVIKRSKSIFNIFFLSINMLGVIISYNRSSVIIAFLLFILYYLLTGYKNKNFINSFKNLALVGIAGVAFFLALSNFLPASTGYLLDRFKELDEKPATKESNNLVYRFYKTERIINKLDTEKVLLGNGSVTENQTPYIKIVNAAAADMGLAEVVYRWGYLGLVLFALLFISSIIKAFMLFIKNEGIVSQLALLLLLTIVSQVLESFISFTFMSPNRFAMGLWYFGILSALIEYNKAIIKSETKLLNDF